MPQNQNTPHERPALRLLGYGLTLLAVSVLMWDTLTLISGRGLPGFSGLADIWSSFDKVSLAALQGQVTRLLGLNVWHLGISPVLSMPAVLLFGLPGLFLMHRYSAEIKVYQPSLREIEMMRMGGQLRRR